MAIKPEEIYALFMDETDEYMDRVEIAIDVVLRRENAMLHRMGYVGVLEKEIAGVLYIEDNNNLDVDTSLDELDEQKDFNKKLSEYFRDVILVKIKERYKEWDILIQKVCAKDYQKAMDTDWEEIDKIEKLELNDVIEPDKLMLFYFLPKNDSYRKFDKSGENKDDIKKETSRSELIDI